jgi:hypothetical protein
MPLVTRTSKGSKLTIQEMDGNLTYLETEAKKGQVTYEDITLDKDLWGGIPITNTWMMLLNLDREQHIPVTINGQDFIMELDGDPTYGTYINNHYFIEINTEKGNSFMSEGDLDITSGFLIGTFESHGDDEIISGTTKVYFSNWSGDLTASDGNTGNISFGITNNIIDGNVNYQEYQANDYRFLISGSVNDSIFNATGICDSSYFDNYEIRMTGEYSNDSKTIIDGTFVIIDIDTTETKFSGSFSADINVDSSISQIVTLPNSEVYEFGLPLDTSFDNTAAVAATEGIRISASTTSNITFEVKTLPIVDLLLTVKIKN